MERVLAQDSIAWIKSDGGPLLLLAEPLLPSWSGSDLPSGGTDADTTDYDRACDLASDYVSPIGIAEGRGLVLGQEPLQTAWIPFEGNRGGTLVRWVYARNDQNAVQLLSALGPGLDWQPDLTLTVMPGQHVLFDSAYPGVELPAHVIRLELPHCSYHVATAWFKPDEHTEMLLHRLVPA